MVTPAPNRILDFSPESEEEEIPLVSSYPLRSGG